MSTTRSSASRWQAVTPQIGETCAAATASGLLSGCTAHRSQITDARHRNDPADDRGDGRHPRPPRCDPARGQPRRCTALMAGDPGRAGRAVIGDALDWACAAERFARPRVVVEQGPAISAQAGVTLLGVTAVESRPGGDALVWVDGGISEDSLHCETQHRAGKPASARPDHVGHRRRAPLPRRAQPRR